MCTWCLEAFVPSSHLSPNCSTFLLKTSLQTESSSSLTVRGSGGERERERERISEQFFL